MSEIESFDAPAALVSLVERVDILVKSVDILKGWNGELAQMKIQSFSHLANCSKRLGELRIKVDQAPADIELCMENMERMKQLKQRMLYTTNNLPQRFNIDNCLKTDSATTDNDQGPAQTSHIPQPQQSSCIVPPVSYLTQEEYEKIPKYLKGRISYDKINNTIALFNKILEKKYTLLKKKRGLTNSEAKSVVGFKRQQLKETIGLYFCVRDDFKTIGGTTLDKTTENILSILRHCGRIREMRSPGILRYVAVY